MSTYNKIYETLNATGLPCAYSHFATPQTPPYVVYIGRGQNVMEADNTHYWKENQYQVEYYYTVKDESKEDLLETALLSAGYLYEKSDDLYLDDEKVYMIVYYI